MMKLWISIGLLLLLGLQACTPKATTPVIEESTESKPEVKPVGPCSNWFEIGKQDYCETQHVLYRDALKQERWSDAYRHWQNVFALAPKADGQRRTHFEDGLVLYRHFFEEASDPAEKEKYIDSVMYMYDRMGACFPEDVNIEGRKGFDYYYKYREFAKDQDIYQLFKASIDKYGLETDYFVINPFTALLIEQFAKGNIGLEETKNYAGIVSQILQKGLDECDGDEECEPWEIINDYTPSRLEELEGTRDFYDCDYYLAKYYQEFSNAPEDCDVIRAVLARFKWGGCTDAEDKVQELLAALNNHCRVASEPGPLRLAYDSYQNGQYQEAVNQFEAYVNESDDPEKRAKYLLLIAKIYYANFKNFPQSRKYARLAAAEKDNWGEPFILIGKLYASSGPLCGTGRGFESQRVVWAALDQFEKAKRLDPSTASEANKWINQYSQYMPDSGDLHMRGLKSGENYTVPCWINENTRIRAKRG